MLAISVLLKSFIEGTSRFTHIVIGAVVTCNVINCSTFRKGVSFVLGVNQMRSEGVVRFVEGLNTVVAEDPLKLF